MWTLWRLFSAISSCIIGLLLIAWLDITNSFATAGIVLFCFVAGWMGGGPDPRKENRVDLAKEIRENPAVREELIRLMNEQNVRNEQDKRNALEKEEERKDKARADADACLKDLAAKDPDLLSKENLQKLLERIQQD